MAPRPRTPTIKLKGQPLAPKIELALLELRVERSIYSPGTAFLRFFDKAYRLLDGDTAVIGDDLEVLIPDSDNSLTTVFKGKVAEVGIEQPDMVEGDTPQLVVRAWDASHRLAHAASFEAYLDHTPGDVVTEIAGRHRLDPKVDAGGAKRYRLQTGTDLYFLGQLAAEVGFEWFVDDQELVFRERPTGDGPTLSPGDGTLLRFSARYSGVGSPGSVEVVGWDPAEQSAVKGTWKAADGTPTARLRSDAPFATDQYRKAHTSYGGELSVPTTWAVNATQAQEHSERIAHRLLDHALHVEGIAAGNPAIRAGGFVTVEQVGTKLSGSYYVTDIVHEFGERQEVRTRFLSVGRPADPRAAAAHQPDALDAWGHFGLVSAVVTNVRDPENLGRVKVKYPTLGEMSESEWARVIAPGAGPERGLDVRPEVEDEVVVGFERGHPHTPLVLGGLWSSKRKLPEDDVVDDGGAVSKRVLKSRAGHSITLRDGDTETEQNVEIALEGGNTRVLIGKDQILIESAQGKPIELVSGSASLQISDGGDLVIKAASLDVKVDGSAKIEGGDISLKGSGGVKVDGGSAFEAKGANAKVEGSASTTIKGGMVKIN